jgi:hypothetical protein
MRLQPTREEILGLLDLLRSSGADWSLVRRGVMHWTGGAHRANAIDLRHYHHVVEGDGTIREGNHSLTQNLRSLRAGDAYAAHTGAMNSWAWGISAAAMAGATERGTFGTHPLTDVQVHRMLLLAACGSHLAGKDPRSVDWFHSHGEAWRKHGVRGSSNHWKWDPERLPWMDGRSRDEVCDWLRETAAGYLEIVEEALRPEPVPLGPLLVAPEPRSPLWSIPQLRRVPLPGPVGAVSLLRRVS